MVTCQRCLTYAYKGKRRMIRESDFKERYVKKDCAENIQGINDVFVDLSGNRNDGKGGECLN